MLGLSFEQEVRTGFRHVLDQVEPRSAYGKQALRNLRPFLPRDSAALQAEWDDVERTLVARPLAEEQYGKLEQILSQIKNIHASIDKIKTGDLSEVDLFELKRYLLQLAELKPLLEGIKQTAGYQDLSLEDMPAALNLLDPEKTRIPSFYISGCYSERLLKIRGEKKKLEQQLRVVGEEEQRHRLNEQRTVCAAQEAGEEVRIRRWLSGQLAPYAEDLLQGTRTLARMDLLLQKASLAKKYRCCKPSLSDKTLQVENMVNPLVEETLKREGRAFTALSIELKRGATVITGANMGGKSVALKTIALNTLLAQCGFFAFAECIKTPLFDEIALVSEELESMDRGLSSFGAEVVRLNDLVERLPKQFMLVLFDEFARGTNPREGAAIASAVANFLNKKNLIAAMTTHYDGVASFAGDHYQVAGLRAIGEQGFQSLLDGVCPDDRVAELARHMDYALHRVEEDREVSKDALNICRWLKCDKEICDFAENHY